MSDSDLFGEPVRLGAPLFVERWSNRKAFWIGVYAGQGLTTPAICDRLADGVTPNVVRAMASDWGFTLPDDVPSSYGPVRVMLAAKDRTRIAAEAKARGVDMPDLCRMVLSQIARDQLWKAVLDA